VNEFESGLTPGEKALVTLIIYELQKAKNMREARTILQDYIIKNDLDMSKVHLNADGYPAVKY
jgi:hypothetical protein